jgi:uncharacterized membrane protein
MAANESIAVRAHRVMLGLVAIEQMCRAVRLQADWVVVDASTIAFEVSQIVAGIELDAVQVSHALERARLVTFRVIE